jgi:hypothetical protein
MSLKNLVITLLLPFAVGHAGTLLYSNTTNDTGFTDSFVQNNLVEAGDEIQLTSAGLATDALTGLYNSGTDGVASTVTLRLYSVDSLENLGTQIASSTLTNVSFTAGSLTDLTFSGLNTDVPQNVVWTLSYTTSDAIALELPDYDPPIAGSSDNTTVWWDTGSGLQLITPGFDTENYFFELQGNPVPEPGANLLAGLGLLVLGCTARLRRSKK